MKPRYSQRVQVNSPAIFSIGSLVGQGRVLDLTIPGCLLESPLSVKVGDRMQLKLILPGNQLPLCVSEGIVRWVNGIRCGVEFVKMSEKDRRQLNQFVTRHLSRSATKPPGEGQKSSELGRYNWHLKTYSL
jgi:hypothetical protein